MMIFPCASFRNWVNLRASDKFDRAAAVQPFRNRTNLRDAFYWLRCRVGACCCERRVNSPRDLRPAPRARAVLCGRHGIPAVIIWIFGGGAVDSDSCCRWRYIYGGGGGRVREISFEMKVRLLRQAVQYIARRWGNEISGWRKKFVLCADCEGEEWKCLFVGTEGKFNLTFVELKISAVFSACNIFVRGKFVETLTLLPAYTEKTSSVNKSTIG